MGSSSAAEERGPRRSRGRCIGRKGDYLGLWHEVDVSGRLVNRDRWSS